jgi:hypothetical protein
VTEAAPALETVNSGIPAWLAKLVTSMLEKEPDQRSSSCEAILEKLKAGDGLGTVREDNATGTSGRGQIEPEHEHDQKKAAAAKEKQVATELNRGTLLIVFLIILGASIIFLQGDKRSSEQQDSGQIENSAAPTEQAPNTIADQAAQLVRKIEAGNPNNLAPCPKEQNAIRHNCWGTASASGDKYVGEFSDGKYHGLGTYHALSNDQFKGDKFVGEFKDNKRNGQGTYTFSGGNKYVGEFRDDKLHGQGTYTFANGYKYVGEFKNDLYHGRGIIYRADGSVEESGIYQNDKLIKSEYIDPNSFSRIAK